VAKRRLSCLLAGCVEQLFWFQLREFRVPLRAFRHSPVLPFIGVHGRLDGTAYPDFIQRAPCKICLAIETSLIALKMAGKECRGEPMVLPQHASAEFRIVE
jgi:hypothetical protein